LFFSGPWDAVVLPADQFFAQKELVRGDRVPEVLVYGPPGPLRAAWIAGAFDYLKEPWEPEELFLRLRGPLPPAVRWQAGGQRLMLESGKIWSETGAAVALTGAETGLLRILVLRRGLAVSREILGWSAGCSSGRAVDTLVGRIRLKLVRAAGPLTTVPEAVRGLGYRLP